MKKSLDEPKKQQRTEPTGDELFFSGFYPLLTEFRAKFGEAAKRRKFSRRKCAERQANSRHFAKSSSLRAASISLSCLQLLW
jgi:hypothetical protein